MSFKFRQYKRFNIYGVRYKGLFIVPDENKKSFKVCTENGLILEEGFLDEEDAAWYIDKNRASDSEKKILEVLFKKEISDLTEIMMEYYQKDDASSKYIYEMAKRIRNRKDEGKEW